MSLVMPGPLGHTLPINHSRWAHRSLWLTQLIALGAVEEELLGHVTGPKNSVSHGFGLLPRAPAALQMLLLFLLLQELPVQNHLFSHRVLFPFSFNRSVW